MATHTHICADCGDEFPCNAPVVTGTAAPVPTCILVLENGDEQCCDDCGGLHDDSGDEPGVIARMH